LALTATGVPLAYGKAVVWKIGGSGTPWLSVGTGVGIDMKAVPGAIQPLELTSEINVIGMLEWTFPRPKTYEARQYGYVWDNDPDPYGISDRLVMVDGDPTTSTEDRFKELGRSNVGKTFYFDLGVPYFLNRCVFYPRQEGMDEYGNPHREDFMGGFVLAANDGSPESFGLNQYGEPFPLFDIVLVQRPRNVQSIVDVTFPLQPVRILKLKSTSERSFEIAEVELYGLGFVAEAIYLSQPIDLGDKANIGVLKWWATGYRRSGRQLLKASDVDASVEVATRLGDDDTPDVYYNANGEEISEEEYRSLPIADRGSILPDRRHWSDWSVYTHSGEQVLYGVPRRFLQFRIRLTSNNITDMVRVDSLQFETQTPVIADSVLGEVAALDNPTPDYSVTRVTGGKRTLLSYDIRAVGPTGRGFDTVEVRTPSLAHFRELLVGRPLVPVQPDTFYNPSKTSLVVRLPYRISDSTPVRIVFECATLLFSTRFSGRVFIRDELPQPVVPGDANPDVQTDGLEIIMSYESEGDLLESVRIDPHVITPNGDGINDVGILSYTLLQLTQERDVRVQIYGMAGRKIRTLWEGKHRSGEYEVPWDGKDDEGRFVPPGVYVYRVTVESDTKSQERSGTVVVVY